MSTAARAVGTAVVAFPVFYACAVLFGAPVFSHFIETATFAAVLSAFTVTPLVFASDGDYNALYSIVLLDETVVLNKTKLILCRHFIETATFAAVLSVFTVTPLVFASDGDFNALYSIVLLDETVVLNKAKLILCRFAFGALLGAWTSCVVIPLDWDRWWQRTIPGTKVQSKNHPVQSNTERLRSVCR
uniref:Na_H_Exchanger domain-containing protein n=1 Tax=Steinernema glaseri TaxID=37863 RepID=A0A1I7Z490_9BILA